ncbi:glycosyltransferase family 2 protein [Uliginosibacterium paludis]|uniref:Glycosyltransferase family 2 protein n=1 Tax=Uliginosibacterium paludis TaxID=1615952 RepID=A0ABV2CN24_9RHOO
MAVEILLSTYNGEKFLREQLDSLLAQTYQDWRLVVRDDGSTDATLAILSEYAQSFPARFDLLSDGQRLGAKHSFSALMARSTAPYLAFCDQDDLWMPEKLEVMMNALREQEQLAGEEMPVLVHCDLALVDVGLQPIAPSFWAFQGIRAERNAPEQLLVENTVTGCATLFNRALLAKAQPVPDSAYMHDYWLALVASCCGRIVTLPQALILYRQHGHNTLGAKQMPGLFSLPRGFLNPRLWSVSYTHACNQARALLERMDSMLPAATTKRIRRFADLYDHGWLGRRWTLISTGALPGRLRRRLSLLSRI